MTNEININKVVDYNLSAEDLGFLLAAGFEPIRGRILHTKKDNKFLVFDEEEQFYDEL